MMAAPRVLVLRAPGTNCDRETAYAFEQAGAVVSSVHVQQLIEEPAQGAGCQILCIPGGFSYGDDIAAGRILAQRLAVHLQDLIDAFINQDRLVIGICNGFQVLMRLGVFFPDSPGCVPATLALNHQARFEDRWVHLSVESTNSVFLKDVRQLYLPVAHAEGRFVIRDEAARTQLTANGQLGLRYCDENGKTTDQPLPFPLNPNGADLNVAGISDPSGRIFGLMPHPERFIDPTHHPFWTRLETLPDYGDGLAIFRNATEYFA
jgi:phosphoribosylformylglycinamidine synthase I